MKSKGDHVSKTKSEEGTIFVGFRLSSDLNEAVDAVVFDRKSAGDRRYSKSEFMEQAVTAKLAEIQRKRGERK
jgi:hypothetical protein